MNPLAGGAWMTREDWARSWKPWLRGTLLGFPIGALPAGGSEIPTFLSYMVERRLSPKREEFGREGAIEGVAGPEAANNAAAAGVLVPLLTLGLPTSATAAILLAAFQNYGLQPGPYLFLNNPDLVWGLIASLYIGNVMLLVLNLPLVGIWVRLLLIPRPWLYGGIMVFGIVGVYGLGASELDLALMVLVGLAGYAMRVYDFPIAPALLGMILGPMAETQLRRALAIGQGSPWTLVESPLSATLLAPGGRRCSCSPPCSGASARPEEASHVHRGLLLDGVRAPRGVSLLLGRPGRARRRLPQGSPRPGAARRRRRAPLGGGLHDAAARRRGRARGRVARASPGLPGRHRRPRPVRVAGRGVECRVWRVGRYAIVPLYLLEPTDPRDQWITRRLYDPRPDCRIAQEMLLGIGGARALRQLHPDVRTYHFNEGHAVFAGVELIAGPDGGRGELRGRLARGAGARRLHHPHAGPGRERDPLPRRHPAPRGRAASWSPPSCASWAATRST